jgi:hypothetical protein
MTGVGRRGSTAAQIVTRMERVKWRGKGTRHSSKHQGLLMQGNNMVNYISEGYPFQNEFLMKK